MKHTASVVLLTASLLWCGGIVLPAVLADTFPVAALTVRMAYSPVCHQRPERSLHVFGHPFSVCERCSAIYFSAAGLFLLFPFRRSIRIPFGIGVRTLLLFLLPVLCDRLLAVANLYHSSSAIRMATGVAAGAGFGLFFPPAWMEAWSHFFRPHLSFFSHNHEVRS